jgi:hypothetical protein
MVQIREVLLQSCIEPYYGSDQVVSVVTKLHQALHSTPECQISSICQFQQMSINKIEYRAFRRCIGGCDLSGKRLALFGLTLARGRPVCDGRQ